jgi:LytS/YehU family sensor histidine kinase/ligand-binding sensor domain-containing protein
MDKDRVYVAYKSGISMKEPGSEKFVRLKLGGSDIKAEAIAYDKAAQALFIFTPTGMVKYGTESKQAKQTTNFKATFRVFSWGLCKDNDGYLWALLERHGYYRYSIARDTGYYYDAEDWPMNLYQDKKGTYYVSTWGSGFKTFDGIKNESSKSTYELPLSDLPGTNYVFAGIGEAPLLTGEDILWVTTQTSGIGLFSKSKKKFVHHFAYKPQQKNGINSAFYWGNYTAPDGTLWICGWHGLTKVNAQNQYFQNAELPELKSSLYNAITGITDDPYDSNAAWMTIVGDGIAKYNKSTGNIIERFYYDEQNVQHYYMERWPVSLYKDSNNIIWGGSYGGFIKIDRGRVSFVSVSDSGRYAFPETHFKDSKGNFWTTGHIVLTFNPYTKKHVTWNIAAVAKNKIYCFSICEGANGLIYAGTNKGIFCIDPFTKVITAISYSASLPNDEKWKKPNAAACIGNILYIGTPNGLAAYNLQTKTTTIIGAEKKLHQVNRLSFYKDKNNMLWVYCVNGLFRYNPSNNEILHFTTTDGLYVSSSDNSYFFEYNNEVYIGSRMAYTKFAPDYINSNTTPPVPYITSVTVNNSPKEIPELSPLPEKLLYNQNSISFDFTAIEYNFPDKLTFSYMLDGFDTSWSSPLPARKKSYTNLPPGRYTFRVKALNNNNVPGNNTAVYSFIIVPAFWQTAWFKILMSVLIVTILYLLYRLRIKQERRKQEEKNKLQIEQYKQQLEMEQIVNFFSTSLADKNTREEVIWDVAKNLIQKLGFANCMIYLWNDDKTELLQKAGYGPNGSLETVAKEPFNSKLWQGIVGHVAATKKPIMLGDTSKDPRYRADVLTRLSELCVPALYNGELISVIDSEDFAKDYYTQQHLQILTTIATLMAARLVSIEAAEETRRKKEELSRMNEQIAQLELASLRSQMNPHFIFNSLNSIHKYIWENKPEDASEYLIKFSKLVRMILENSKEKEVPLADEINLLHLYIELEHRRCNGKFNYSITVDEKVDAGNIAIPSMIVQPYVENAIWHGLVQKIGNGTLYVSFTINNNHLECIIEDDGIGREKAMEIKLLKQDTHKSLGLGITSKRVGLLYNEKGETASVEVIDKKDRSGNSTGTKVILLLPLQYIYLICSKL